MLTLNCDLGELTGDSNQDALIMPYIDQANIACGFHASDPLTMQTTVTLACQHNVTIGAHPSYPDRENFGRMSMTLPKAQLIACLQYQIGALQAICQAQGTSVSYVKPHGALYNDMMAKPEILHTVCQAIALLDNSLALVIQAHPDNQEHQAIAQQYQLTLKFEAFADRGYQDNGLLIPRNEANAVLIDSQQVLARVKALVQNQQLSSVNQQKLVLNVDTLCVHGDNKAAVNLVKTISDWLNE
ncbi:UPF0271 protein [Thalassotalea insulae]|uniref:UPF0271 protein n=1 Tax=Thalassotalea insulae TaxID=2056778 RepID=A0ABQ6GQ19_9GAMM|nr:5-oxoprolinase subunit PxpA [Thalassotalea insulae]GLX78027.1 UPF0271 protein [Thalassotalea insulae]